jgi:hypothetical protein
MKPTRNIPPDGRLKLLLTACGFLGILWLSFEDNTLSWLKLLSLLFSGLLISYHKRLRSNNPAWFHYPLLGLVFGILVTFTTLLMIILKAGLHDHSFPEYSVEQIKDVVYLTPIWGLSAMLVALGSQLWRQSG